MLVSAPPGCWPSNRSPDEADVVAALDRQPVPLRRPAPDGRRRRLGRPSSDARRAAAARRAEGRRRQPAPVDVAAGRRPTARCTCRSARWSSARASSPRSTQIAADELDVAPAAAGCSCTAHHGRRPGRGTDGRQHVGRRLRRCGARRPAPRCGRCSSRPRRVASRSTSATSTLRDGGFGPRDGDGWASYGELAADVDLDVDVDASVPRPQAGREPADRHVAPAGRPSRQGHRGRARFIQDLVLPGQLWGQVVRPPSPAATLTDVSTEAVEAMPGVSRGRARRLLPRRRRGRRAAGGPGGGGAAVGVGVAGARVAARRGRPGGVPARRAGHRPSTPRSPATPRTRRRQSQVRKLSATYTRPFLAHASMSPSCGMAQWSADSTGVHVWSHTQNVFGLRGAIASALGLAPDMVAVEHVEGAGAYGHNGADDAAFDAVLLARAVPGRPVHVRWRRADELSLVAVRLGDGGRRRRLPVRRGPDGVLGGRRLEPGPHLAAGLRRVAGAAGLRAPGRRRSGFPIRWTRPPSAAPAARATRYRATPSRCAGSAAIGGRTSRCARRRCGRSAPTATSSRSSR